ncbi:MAG: sugar ABC transporter ATP-binding protein [Phycisphaerae bacterium]|nr:sugar ABC transporter ATP-binding protein [Phycisphaerae bacterium]
MTDTGSILLEARGIFKSFGAVQALSGVDLVLRAGTVHALVGENGAGKSTLSKIIAGVHLSDSGRMILEGKPFQPSGRRQAEHAGIRMVMQELNLIDTLSVAENIFLDQLPSKYGFVRYPSLNHSAQQVMSRVGLDSVSPSAIVGSLGVGTRQMVEIAAGLSRHCRILILDEPTASLTDREANLLFRQIDQARNSGMAIVYISHRIEEILRIADEITILRDGRLVSTQTTQGLTAEQIIRSMVGRDLPPRQRAGKTAGGTIALQLDRLCAGPKVRKVSLDLRRGEILGLAGLMGSGRTELARAIFGADPIDSGTIYLHGSDKPARIRSPRDAVRQGIALLTEDRKQQGLFLPRSIRYNISLPRLESVSRAGIVNRFRERKVCDEFVQSLSIRCSGLEQPVGQLSGGNQQKVVIAKWLLRDCEILIFDEPTRGIDVGAKFEVYRLLSDLAARGKAVLFISSDLKELTAVCDRIAVLSAGRLTATFTAPHYSEQAITEAAFQEHLRPAGGPSK